MSGQCEEYCDIYEERYRTARKKHRCTACKRARALTGDSSVAIPIVLVDAVDAARKELP